MRTATKALTSPVHIALLGICVLVSLENFLAFHMIVEFFAIIIAVQICVVAWSTRAFSGNRVLLLIGSGFLWVGLLDLFHTLTYRGMNIVTLASPFPAAQFWVAARGMQIVVLITALSPLAARLPPRWPLAFFGALTAILVFLIYQGLFPDCFVAGQGQTPFKIYAEYAFFILFIAIAFIASRSRGLLKSEISQALVVSSIIMALSEAAFSFYVDQFAYQNIIGHLLKISAFYVMFRGLVQSGFQLPLDRLQDETRRRRFAEEQADRERDRIKHILTATKFGLWEWDIKSGRVFFDMKWADLGGFTSGGQDPVSIEEWRALIHPEDFARSRAVIDKVLAGEIDSYSLEFRMRRQDGRWMWVLSNGHVIERNDDGQPTWVSGLHSDVTERIERTKQLELAATVFDVAREGIVIADQNAQIISANPAVTEITGYPHEEVIGQNPRIFSSGLQSKEFYEEMWTTLLSRGYWEGEVWNRHKGGQFYAELLKVATIRDDEGRVTNFISLFSDITRQKNHQKELERIAYFDALTGLPNRVLLADRLRQAILEAKRQQGISACIYLDIDDFKRVNDAHGHDFADRLLVVIAERIRRLMREIDTLSRVGGDEFVGIVSDIADEVALEGLLERILRATAEPVEVDGETVEVSVSIGVSLFSQGKDLDADLLLRQADQALYQSKLRGRNCFTLFDEESDRAVRTRYETIAQVREAFRRGEFRLFYQPKADLTTKTILGAEALIRWQHPDLGLLPPSQFLPSIQGHPVSIEIGEWVIQTALAQIDAWRKLGIDMTVSVNVDLRHLHQQDFPDRLKGFLAEYPQLDRNVLDIEILETSGLEDESAVIDIIHRCVALGVTFSLDDFGTGFSSLSYLGRLPVAQIKIDQGFVRDMLLKPGDQAIVSGIVKLAGVFGMDVIAEAVETEEIEAALLKLGCTRIQGYHLSRPLPASAFLEWLMARRSVQ